MKWTKQRKTVCFFPRVGVCTIPNRDDYTTSELQATWYNRVDLATTRQQCRTLLGQIRDKGTFSNFEIQVQQQGDSLRGLERYIKKRGDRLQARRAVLFEQAMQDAEGMDDPDAIAEVYQIYSNSNQRNACMIGLLDQQAMLICRRVAQGGSSCMAKLSAPCAMSSIEGRGAATAESDRICQFDCFESSINLKTCNCRSCS